MKKKDLYAQIQQIVYELSLNDAELYEYAEIAGMNTSQYRLYRQLCYDSVSEKLDHFYWKQFKKTWAVFAAAALAICCIGLSVFCYYNGKTMYQKGETAGYTQGVSDTKSKYSASNSSGVTVYVTPSGKRYHEKGCKYLSDEAFSISLKEAKKNGYSACTKCKPPK